MSLSKINKQVVLLVNLGSPASLDVASIRLFLRKFLSDRRVVNLPKLIWYPILFGIILPLRAKKLLKKYQLIWQSSGMSPLVFYTKQQTIKLQALMNQDVLVDYAFCYGNDDIYQKLQTIEDKYTITKLTVLPLYPQYSSSTSAAVFDLLAKYYADKYYLPEICFKRGFADNDLYIECITDAIERSWSINGRGDKLVISFHSIPTKMVENGDSYVDECNLTANAVCDKLMISRGDIIVCYQSKFGRAQWVTPMTSQAIVELAQKGHKSIDIICPGFIADCLETLEEVNVEYKNLFLTYGGEQFNYIECLNDSEQLTNALKNICEV